MRSPRPVLVLLWAAAWAEDSNHSIGDGSNNSIGDGSERVGNTTDATEINPYPWFFVDAPAVLCTGASPPAPGRDVFRMNISALIKESDGASPHIITILRKTDHAMDLTLQVTDADGKDVISPTQFTLSAFNAADDKERRLSFLKPDRARKGVVWHTKRKQLRSGLASGDDGGAGGVAAFGYDSARQMRIAFSGGYKRTPYGYSGAWGVSSSNMFMAASIVLSGRSVADLYHGSELVSAGHECSALEGGTAKELSCRACVEKFKSDCRPALPKVANRDDLMSTGFWPEDFASPLTVTVTALGGAGIDANTMCPGAEKPVPPLDIFISLTRMQAMKAAILAKEINNEVEGEQKDLARLLYLMCGLGCVCFCCCIFGCVQCLRKLADSGDAEDKEGYAALRRKQ